MKTPHVEPGDRVEHITTGHLGTVVFSDALFVRVHWDDHQVGILSYDSKVMTARHLQKLRAPSSIVPKDFQ